MAPTPILVIGKNRSGTKWLANLLCNHSQVVGVQQDTHQGVLETNFFGQMQAIFGDLSPVETFVAVVEAWSQTDFFRASGCSKEMIYSHRPRPRSYSDLFHLVMNDLALRASSHFWLQKTSPLQGDYALCHFSEARPVLIRRDMEDTVNSTLQLSRNLGHDVSTARVAFRFVLEDKLLRRLQERGDAVCVEYADLSADTVGELTRVCAALGLGYEPGMEKVHFSRNTSFATGTRHALAEHDRRVMIAVSTLTRLLPRSVLSWTHKRVRNRSPRLVRGSYREIVKRYALE